MKAVNEKPHDPRLASWVEVPSGSDFPIQNLPYGIFEAPGREPRAGVAIGAEILDLAETARLGLLEASFPVDLFSQPSLNALLGRGRAAGLDLRRRISRLLDTREPELRDASELHRWVLVPQREARMRVPMAPGDYVDFYSSLEHATNVGSMFRDPANPLLENWRWLPIGYHGRTSSIIPSGHPVRRPWGQRKPKEGPPEFTPTRRLDFELEVGFVVGTGSRLGEPVPVGEAEDHIAGLLLVNDWSARDIQQWEYVPLGPFLGKSFATSVSPWLVTLEALQPFRVEGPAQQPAPFPYLRTAGFRNFDLHLEVAIQAVGESAEWTVCRTNFRTMYWNAAQQLAHLTSNGANVRTGDLCASGTVSGPEPGSFGSLLELSWNGTKPLESPGGSERTFLADGDTVILRGWCQREGVRVGFGEVRNTVLPPLAGLGQPSGR